MNDPAVRGIPWTLVTFGATRVLSFATTLGLARLLSPRDFGLFALASLITLILTILRDLGLGASLIVRRDYGREEQATVVTMILASGLVYTALVAATAPLAALAFDEPRLTGLLIALSLASAAGGVGWAYDVVMQRELAFRRRFTAHMVNTFGFAVVALGLGFAGAGVWSFVGGTLAGTIGGGLAFYLLSPYRLPLRWDGSIVRDAMDTSKGFIAQGLLTVTRQNADYLVVGRVLGPTALGLYSMGYRICELPTIGIADSVAKVTFTAFADMRHRGEDVLGSFLGSLRMVALVTAPMGVLLSAAAGPFVHAVLGPEWEGLIGALAVLGIWAALRPLESTAGWLLNSLGKPGPHARILAAVLCLTIPGLVVAAWLGDIVTVSYVTLADMVITVPVLAVYAHRRLDLPLGRQWAAVRPVVLASVVMWGVVRGLDVVAGDEVPAFVALAGLTVAGLAAYVAVLAVAERGLLGTARAQVLRAVRPA